jgi:hypothetical protein
MMAAGRGSGELTDAGTAIDAARLTDLADFAPFPDLATRRLGARDWLGYLLLFGHQRQRAAFLKILPALDHEPPEVYWSILGQVWSAAEAPGIEDEVDWRALFADPRPNREYLMGVDERRAYARLPETVQVYRGAGHPDFARGLSWTLAHEEAVWFGGYATMAVRRSGARQLLAAASAQEPCVAHGSVARADVVALLGDGRGKAASEIIALPQSVQVAKIERLDRSGRVEGCDDELASRHAPSLSPAGATRRRAARAERGRRMAPGSAPR